MQTIDKDALYFIVFTWFILQLVQFFFSDNYGFASFIQLIVSGILACIVRHDAEFIIFPTLVVMILIIAKRRKRIAMSFVIILLAYIGLNSVTTNFLGLTNDNPVEALGVPLQQMARYVTECEDEITEEEREIIDEVIRYEGIP